MHRNGKSFKILDEDQKVILTRHKKNRKHHQKLH